MTPSTETERPAARAREIDAGSYRVIITNSKGTVTSAVYVKYSFDREKREALERWATHLDGLVGSGQTRELVRLIT